MSRREKITADVEKYGWFIFKVVDDELPPFAYTVGLYANFSHPELILSGVDIDTAHAILNGLGEGIKAGQNRNVDIRYSDILVDQDCIFKRVSESQYDEYVGQAMVYYNDEIIPFLQCVYPNNEGLFPWEKGYKQESQELLY